MTDTSKPEDKDEAELRKFVADNYKKVRKCNFYEMEYDECTSVKGRFQQYYLYGETLDCNKWKEDLKNCNIFFNSDDIDYNAAASIIRHENERLEKRMKAHEANDVWEKRSEPPSHWNSKLPEWLEKRQERSFPAQPVEVPTCVIS